MNLFFILGGLGLITLTGVIYLFFTLTDFQDKKDNEGLE